jgi:hypothetical protein
MVVVPFTGKPELRRVAPEALEANRQRQYSEKFTGSTGPELGDASEDLSGTTNSPTNLLPDDIHEAPVICLPTRNETEYRTGVHPPQPLLSFVKNRRRSD